MGLLIRSIMMTISLALILCGFYPLFVTGIGQMAFYEKANGSLIRSSKGSIVGSVLIGQSFSNLKYFHGRLSAAGDKGYDATNSSGSNLGPTNQKLVDRVRSDVAKALRENPASHLGEVPNDLVTTSASGLDPDISPKAALYQVARVSEARGIPEEKVGELVLKHIKGRQLGIFGEEVVNVLELNMALDQLVMPK